MKLVTYIKEERDQLALLVDGLLYDTDLLHPDLPISMAMFLNYWDDVLPLALAVEQRIKDGQGRSETDQIRGSSPRDDFAWRQQRVA